MDILLEQNVAERNPHLSLSMKRLDAMPEALLKLSHVTSLNLQHNKLKEVPLQLAEALPRLVALNLKSNKLKEVPSASLLHKWTNLESLQLPSNQIKHTSIEFWEELPASLSSLDLSHNNIECLVDGISPVSPADADEAQATDHERGTPRNTSLPLRSFSSPLCSSLSSSLSPSIPGCSSPAGLSDIYKREDKSHATTGRTKNLQVLKLRSNHLTSFCSLSSSFTNNNINISSITEWFSLLRTLRVLDLSHNSLKYIPEQVSMLTCLVEFYASNNKLSAAPLLLAPDLKILDLSHNKLTHFLPSRFHQRNINASSPSANVMSSLMQKDNNNPVKTTMKRRRSVLELKRTFELAASGSSVSSSPSLPATSRRRNSCVGPSRSSPSFVSSKKIKEVGRGADPMDELERFWQCLNSLTQLSLNKNRIADLPSRLWTLPHLNSLNISANQLTALNIPSSALSPIYKRSLSPLQFLSVSRNLLHSLPPEVGRLATLQSFYAGKNRITSIPPSICRLTNLRNLDLTANCLSDLAHLDLSRCVSLEELGLARNPIVELPHSVVTILQEQRQPMLRLPYSLLPSSFDGCSITNPSPQPTLRHYPSPSSEHSTSSDGFPYGSSSSRFCTDCLSQQDTLEEEEEMNAILSPFVSRSWLNVTSSLPDEIIPGLYLGSLETLHHLAMLQHRRVTHILRIMSDGQAEYPHLFHYLEIRASDETTEDLLTHFETSTQWLEQALSNGGRVFCHCVAGISRSASLVIAFLMKKFDLSFDEAHRYLRGRRPVIAPNRGFVRQLKAYEALLKESSAVSSAKTTITTES
ncbi:dual specificity phosphatase 12 [Balamuthia mandrillaris]